MLPLWELQYTNKPCCCVFNQQGSYDFYPIRLIKRRLFILKEYGVVCHINTKFGKKTFKGKKATWFYDMGRSEGVGSPFDPQKPFNANALKKLKGQSRLRMNKRSFAQIVFKKKPRDEKTDPENSYEQVDPDSQMEEPRPFTKKEAKQLEQTLKQFKTTDEMQAFLEDNGIQIIDPLSMEGDDFEDDGGFDDEEAIFQFGEEMLNIEKQSKDMSSKPLKPTLKIAVLMPIIFIIIIVIVASPNIINSIGNIKLPAINFGFLNGLVSFIPKLLGFLF